MQQDLLDTLFLNKKALADVGDATDTNQQGANGGSTATKGFTMKDSATASSADAADKCPVDHTSREAWMEQAKAAREAQQKAAQPPAQIPSPPTDTKQTTSSSWGWRIPFFSSSSSAQSIPTSKPQQPPNNHPSLATDRVVSSIPRSTSSGATSAACPVNNETETGADPKTGNWVYPSEKMFFEAMKRKGHDTRAADMQTVVPIHNAVNERAWKEIKEWEKPYSTEESCPGGPRLYSFTGLSTTMSPKARINTLLGYTAPFDRHDWIVDRCGTKVEYVIDFYAGKSDKMGRPSFYLDVRPKLNSWEGVKMRASRAVGLV